MSLSKWRADEIKRYEKNKSPEDCIENAALCERYSEGAYPFSCDDAIFWLKKALEIRETLYGKNNIENIKQYENLAYIYAEKLSHSMAIKWYKKAIMIRESYGRIPDLPLVVDYINVAKIYGHIDCYTEYEKNIFYAKQLVEEKIPSEKSVAYYVYAVLADYYSGRYYHGFKPGGQKPVKPEEDVLLEKDALEKMVASAIEEYGNESCEAVACLEKYIHDTKMPPQERLDIAGKILRIYFDREEAFNKRKKLFDSISDFIESNSRRIASDIWSSWSTSLWFPWDETRNFRRTGEAVGWGMKWIKQNVSEAIAEKLILQFTMDKQVKIREIIEKNEMRPPLR